MVKKNVLDNILCNDYTAPHLLQIFALKDWRNVQQRKIAAPKLARHYSIVYICVFV